MFCIASCPHWAYVYRTRGQVVAYLSLRVQPLVPLDVLQCEWTSQKLTSSAFWSGRATTLRENSTREETDHGKSSRTPLLALSVSLTSIARGNLPLTFWVDSQRQLRCMPGGRVEHGVARVSGDAFEVQNPTRHAEAKSLAASSIPGTAHWRHNNTVAPRCTGHRCTIARQVRAQLRASAGTA